MILLLDNYDSFTYNLLDYLQQSGTECKVVRNDATSLKELEKENFKGIVISPGPKKPVDAGILMDIINHFHDKLPILGICLGHQALGEYFGGKLVKAGYPMHGKVAEIYHDKSKIFENIPSPFMVMRYHSLILKDLDTTSFKTSAKTASGEIMAAAHIDLPIFGVQFHPESILTIHGLQLIENWLKIIY